MPINSNTETVLDAATFTFRYGSRLVYHVNQSSTFNIADWIALLTLCFAPLIAHILSGVPAPVFLDNHRPRWHDRIVLYNPATIIWRYLAIVDRRVRTKAWDSSELAAVNAIFWTEKGWDGSEGMAEKSKEFLVRRPLRRRSLLSSAHVATLIISLQGVQAIYSITRFLTGRNGLHEDFYALSTVFLWLSAMGLLRLPAAWWITDDYTFEELGVHGREVEVERQEMVSVSLSPPPVSLSLQHEDASLRLLAHERPPLPHWDSLGSFNNTPLPIRKVERRAVLSWQSILVRVLMTGAIGALAGVAIDSVLTQKSPDGTITAYLPLTMFVENYMYVLLGAPATILMAFYTLKGERSTILPCAGRVWFKVFTLFWYALAGLAVVVAALETTRTPCGHYTSAWVSKKGREMGCPVE